MGRPTPYSEPRDCVRVWSLSARIQAQINMTSYYEPVERAPPRNCSADWVAVTKYVDDVLIGNDTVDTIKRALYTARVSRPGGHTTLVEHLSDLAVLALPSDMTSVLLDPTYPFQVSRSFTVVLQWNLPRSSRSGYHISTHSPTAWRLATSQLAPHQKVLTLPREPTLLSTRLWPPSLKLRTGVAKVPAMWYVFLRLLLIPHALN